MPELSSLGFTYSNGEVTVMPGTVDGQGENLNIVGGTSDDFDNTGGDVQIVGGIGDGPNNGGGVNLLAGAAGSVYVQSGDGTAGSAGTITLQGGGATGASRHGGNINIYGGSADSGESGGNITFRAGFNGTDFAYVVINGLPTSKPPVAGALWDDLGTLKISDGA